MHTERWMQGTTLCCVSYRRRFTRCAAFSRVFFQSAKDTFTRASGHCFIVLNVEENVMLTNQHAAAFLTSVPSSHAIIPTTCICLILSPVWESMHNTGSCCIFLFHVVKKPCGRKKTGMIESSVAALPKAECQPETCLYSDDYQALSLSNTETNSCEI